MIRISGAQGSSIFVLLHASGLQLAQGGMGRNTQALGVVGRIISHFPVPKLTPSDESNTPNTMCGRMAL